MSEFVKNEENAALLLEWLDNGAPHTILAMETWGSDIYTAIEDEYESVVAAYYDDVSIPETCGTAACIAGAACMMAQGTWGDAEAAIETDLTTPESDALRWLGITKDANALDAYHPLFCPEAARDGCGGLPTSQDAANALRNTIQSGDPKWGQPYVEDQTHV